MDRGHVVDPAWLCLRMGRDLGRSIQRACLSVDEGLLHVVVEVLPLHQRDLAELTRPHHSFPFLDVSRVPALLRELEDQSALLLRCHDLPAVLQCVGARDLHVDVLSRLQALGCQGALILASHCQPDRVHVPVRQYILIVCIGLYTPGLFHSSQRALMNRLNRVADRHNPVPAHPLHQWNPVVCPTRTQPHHRDPYLIHSRLSL